MSVQTKITIIHPDELSEPIQQRIAELMEEFPDIDINFEREVVEEQEDGDHEQE